MKLKIRLLLLSLLLLTQCTAGRIRHNEDENNVIVLNPSLPAFTGLEANSGWDIILSQGDTPSVRMEVSPHLADRVIAEVRRGVLHFGLSPRSFRSRTVHHGSFLRAYVTVTDLSSITASGGVGIECTTPIRHEGTFQLSMSGGTDLESLRLSCSLLQIELSGGTDAEIELQSPADLSVITSGGSDLDVTGINARTCTVKVSGGSDVDLIGRTQKFTADCIGGADLSASKLISAECIVKASGAATVHVYASTRLDAVASGASDIYYYGPATQVSTKASNASSIIRRR